VARLLAGQGTTGKSESMQIFPKRQAWSTPCDQPRLRLATHRTNGPHVITAKQPSINMDSATYGVCEGDPRGYDKEKVDLDTRIYNDGAFVATRAVDRWVTGRLQRLARLRQYEPGERPVVLRPLQRRDVVEIKTRAAPRCQSTTPRRLGIRWNQWKAGYALN